MQRPAGLLVKEAKKFQSATTLAAKGKTAAAGKLIAPPRAWASSRGDEVTVQVRVVRMRMLRSRHSRSSSRKICNSSIDIESEGTGNGKIHRESPFIRELAIGPINGLKKSDGIVKASACRGCSGRAPASRGCEETGAGPARRAL